MFLWHILFESGKLEVVGMDDSGIVESGYALQTSERPHGFLYKTHEPEINKNKGLAQVEISVVDENGIPVVLSDNEITCTIFRPRKTAGIRGLKQ